MKFMRKLLCLSYLEHRTNEHDSLVAPMEPLHRAIVKRWQIIWFGHVTRHYSLCIAGSREGTIECVRIGEGDNVGDGRQHHKMNKHDHAKRLGEGCVESLAWRTTSASSV